MSNKKDIDTDVLVSALESTASYDDFLDKNEEHLGVDQFKLALRKLLAKKNMTPVDVMEEAHIERTYGYQLFNGTRKPSRDKVIQLAYGLKLSLNDANQLLKCAQKQPLYAKSKRDSVIIYGISNQMSIDDINDLLNKNMLQLL